MQSTTTHAETRSQADDSYHVTGVTWRYVHQFAMLTAPNEQERLARTPIVLGLVDGVLVGPGEGGEQINTDLGSLGSVHHHFSASALQAIADAIERSLEDEYQSQFYVALDPRDVDPATGADRRPRTRTSMGFKIEYTGPTHHITGFDFIYAFDEMADHPRVRDLNDVHVSLIPSDDMGYVAWRPGVEPSTYTLAELNERGETRYTAAAVQQVLVAVRDYFTERHYMAVRVTPSEMELMASMDEATRVPLLIVAGVVTEMRTLASGERFPPEERVNHPAHRRIMERSPIQPGVEGQQFLRKDELDRHIFFLGRHPGRRIDVGIAPAQDDLTVSLDYLVTENRPLVLYAQISNTGTAQVGRLRQRFGLFHSQFTGNDDILSIDYNTSNFKDSHTVLGSYEARFFDMDRLRWRVHGMYSEFDASEVGLANLRFKGDSWAVGGELIANIYQDRQLFVDVIGGARFMHTNVRNTFQGFEIVRGEEDFLLPHIGLRMEHLTELSSTIAAANFEFNFGSVTNLDTDGLNRLGRLFPDRNSVVLRWDAFHSFYLEPLLNPSAFRDVSTPDSSTLAHELAFSFRGQYAMGNRFTPQSQMVAGGLYSVRGYPESVSAGDTVLIGSAEYRFHLPRALDLQADPGDLFGQEFRWAPQQVYGRADWDLIFRGFVDVARTLNTDRLIFEQDDTLIGAGVGVELLVKRNLNLRVDWGFALKGLEDRVSSGSNRVHFVATILY